MIGRELGPFIKEYIGYNPVLFLNGPRQSGKTTLLKSVLPDYDYISLEDPDIYSFVESDPRGFIENMNPKTIIDEAQRFPKLFNYLQNKVDSTPSIKVVLSGSQNFLLHQGISQSLAGRTGILTLLPLTNSEIMNSDFSSLLKKWEEIAVHGHYPGIFDRNIPPGIFYNGYVSTYIERDVRLLKNIGDLGQFYRFVKLCAGRAGQILNISSLAADTGISPNSAATWISILEASYIVFRINPYYKNFNKRLVKAPKLYFNDTGLLCFLLDIKKAEDLQTHYARGAIFENLIISEIVKNIFNKGRKTSTYYWRSQKGKEIDLLIDEGSNIYSIEIKSGITWNISYFENLNYWQNLTGIDPKKSYVVFGGSGTKHSHRNGTLISWDELSEIYEL